MTKEDIRDMFLVAAAVRHMKEDDPRLEMAAKQLSAMEKEYFATVLDAKPGQAEAGVQKPVQPDWKGALTYLINVFMTLDAAAKESKKADPEALQAEIAERHAVWEIVSNGVMNWYQQQETQPEAKPDPGK